MSTSRELTAGAVSVLIPTYAGAHASDLSATLDSVWAQTRPADVVLVIEDGPLTDALYEVLSSHRKAHQNLETLSLPTNQGAGPARQAGLSATTTEYVMWLDADDLAAPDRLRTQRDYLEAHPDISVLGTAVQEFDDEAYRASGDVNAALGNVRMLPETHEDILKYSRINNPVNNPSMMARTQDLLDAGGYQSVHHMEDYDLCARMLGRGYRFHNLPDALTYFRTSAEQFNRRTGRGMFAAEIQMQRNLVSYGLVSTPRSLVNLLVRTCYRLLPAALLTRVYSRLFHRDP